MLNPRGTVLVLLTICIWLKHRGWMMSFPLRRESWLILIVQQTRVIHIVKSHFELYSRFLSLVHLWSLLFFRGRISCGRIFEFEFNHLHLWRRVCWGALRFSGSGLSLSFVLLEVLYLRDSRTWDGGPWTLQRLWNLSIDRSTVRGGGWVFTPILYDLEKLGC